MPKIRNIIIFVAIAGVFILIYIFFIKPSSSPTTSLVSSPSSTTFPSVSNSTTTTNTTGSGPSVAQDFLTLLLSVRNIKLNDTIFSDPAFNSLHDSSITLTPDATTGRPNPFAQFGNDVSTTTTTSIPPVTSTGTTTSPTNPTPVKP